MLFCLVLAKYYIKNAQASDGSLRHRRKINRSGRRYQWKCSTSPVSWPSATSNFTFYPYCIVCSNCAVQMNSKHLEHTSICFLTLDHNRHILTNWLKSSRLNRGRIDERAETLNAIFGGLQPGIRRVVFTNGDMDPWRMLSVQSEYNNECVVLNIAGNLMNASLLMI